MTQYYYRIYGVNFGPVSFELLQHEIASGQLSGNHEVRRTDETSWTTIADFIAGGIKHDMPSIQTSQSIRSSEGDHFNPRTLWYVRMGRAEHGPMEFHKLIEMVTAGRILPIDRVRQSDQIEWTAAEAIPTLFPSYPGSLRDGSSFATEPSRPSVTVPSDLIQNNSLRPTVTNPHVTPAPVQHQTRLLLQPAATTAADSPPKGTENSQHSELQTLNCDADFKVASTRQITKIEHSASRSKLSPNSGMNPSPPQPKIGPYPKFQGEIKPKPRTDHIGDSQPLFSGNLLLALAGCVLIICLGRSMIPAEVGQFESPLGELSTAYHALDKERLENPKGEVRGLATKEFVDKIDSAKQRITNLYTEHDIRLILLTLSDNLIRAAKSEESEELTTYMEVSRNLLGSATRELQKWKDESQRKKTSR